MLPPIKLVFVTSRIGRENQARASDRLLQLKGRHTRLADHIKIIDVDLNDLVHPVGADHDTAVDRHRTARVPNAAAARRNRK